MSVRLAAFAALVAVSAIAWPANAADRLSLDDAFARVAESHPDLRLLGARHNVLAAELGRATLRPPLVAGASVENAFGTGEASGLSGAELTLTLASVLERGGKLDARRTLAQSRIDALAVEREARRLDLLAEVARRYLAMVAAQRCPPAAITTGASACQAPASSTTSACSTESVSCTKTAVARWAPVACTKTLPRKASRPA